MTMSKDLMEQCAEVNNTTRETLYEEYKEVRAQQYDLQRNFLPLRGMNLEGSSHLAEEHLKQQRKDQHLNNSLPKRCARTLQSGMQSGLTSPSRPWFTLGVPDPDLTEYRPVRVWLDKVQRRMLDAFRRCGVYRALKDCYVELGVFGTNLFTLERDPVQGMRAHPFTAGTFMIGCDEYGNVKSIYREYFLTAEQIRQNFYPEDRDKQSMPEEVKHALDQNKPRSKFLVCHLVEPNDYRLELEDVNGRPIRSMRWLQKSGHMLKVGGFDHFPGLTPRWERVGDLPYGNSPAMDCVGDAKHLQSLYYDRALAAEKIVEPPLKAAGANPGDINTVPGGVSVDSQIGGRSTLNTLYEVPYQSLEVIDRSILMTRQEIQETMYTDLFRMLLDGDPYDVDRTATEVAMKGEERLNNISPVIEDLNDDLLDPMIDLAFQYMLEDGQLPEPPREIQGQRLKVEYISPMAKAQRMIGVQSTERLLGVIGNVAGLVPQIVHKFDFDELMEDYADRIGVIPAGVNDDDKVAKIRKQIADQQRQQTQLEQQKLAAEGAKTMADTEVSDGRTLLQQMAGVR